MYFFYFKALVPAPLWVPMKMNPIRLLEDPTIRSLQGAGVLSCSQVSEDPTSPPEGTIMLSEDPKWSQKTVRWSQ